MAVQLRECRVSAVSRLSHDVVALRLEPGQRLDYVPGQYIEVLMADGRHRPFSVANAPQRNGELELHIRFYGGSSFPPFLGMDLREGTVLRVRGPFGDLRLRARDELPAIFVAGGTGFAPIKGLIEQALSRPSTQPLHLYWGARARQDLYLDRLPRVWSDANPRLHYVPVLSEPAPSDHWLGRTGLAHEAVLTDFSDLSSCEVYCAGPPLMVQAVRESFFPRGLKEERFFSDALDAVSNESAPEKLGP